MQALRVVMLLVTVLVAYLLFIHPAANPGAKSAETGAAVGPARAGSQYKEAMDRAHAAAKAMQAERKEADVN